MKKRLIVLVVLFALILTACDNPLFENEEAKYTIKRYTKDELDYDRYYVKDGSGFYSLYLPQSIDSIFWLEKDISLVPHYYKNEMIAYQSQSSEISSVSVTRLKDLGYCPGMFGLRNDGTYLSLNATSNMVPGYDAAYVFNRAKSEDIRIERINGKVVSDYTLSDYGILTGFTKGDAIRISYYEGTMYNESEIAVDAHLYTPFEKTEISDISITKNGYLSLKMPEDAKTGIYMIDKAGAFFYHDHEKGSCPEAENYNEPYYVQTAEDILEGYQQYIVSVAAKTYDVGFYVSYTPSQYSTEAVKCVMKAPDGELYTMECTDGSASLSLTEAMAGKWTLNIYPSGTTITNISVDSTKMTKESIMETYEFKVEGEGNLHRLFKVTPSNVGAVWGVVENNDTHVSKELVPVDADYNRNDEPFAYCVWKFIEPGDYTVKVYHYNDVSIKEATMEKVDENYSVDTIIFE